MTLIIRDALTYSGGRPVQCKEVSTFGDWAGADKKAFIPILRRIQ
jgi:hypothetical protein